MSAFARFDRFNDDDFPTKTSIEQIKVEKLIEDCYENYFQNDSQIVLFRSEHINYLKSHFFQPLDERFSFLDISRTWLVYWISLSLNILGESQFLKDNSDKIINFLNNCKSPKGGYGAGPSQEAHLASTYAAVNAIVTIGNDIALQSLDVEQIQKFLHDMQQPDGSFTLHECGEIDIRGAYCALSVAKLLNIPIYSEDNTSCDLFQNTAQWIASCQTYEGGFGATPGNEAHGGYTFCGVSVLVLLDQIHLCDIDALLRWVVNKQLQFEGGFSGRTNKLVDGCYSFWNGSVIPILQSWMATKKNLVFERWLFNQESLQEYILICCQSEFGGLADKPGRKCDFYHSCYTLSGLSIAQHSMNNRIVIGIPDNLVEPTHPIFNVPLESIKSVQLFFQKK